MLQRVMSLQSLVVVLLFSLVLTSALGKRPNLSSFSLGDEAIVYSPDGVDSALFESEPTPTPPVIQCIRALCGPFPDSEVISPLVQPPEPTPSPHDVYPNYGAETDDVSLRHQRQMKQELQVEAQNAEVQRVRQERMTQLEQRRQHAADKELPPLPLDQPPQLTRLPGVYPSDAAEADEVARYSWATEQMLQQKEAQQVQQQRMAQLERRRQEAAANDLPSLPASVTQQSDYSDVADDMEALADLLVMLDAVVAVEQQVEEAAAADCMVDMRSGESESERSEPAGAGAGAMMEEVVVVVAGDRWGRTMLIEMHRQIYHADESPCSHFAPHAEQQQYEQHQGQLDAQPHASQVQAPEVVATPVETSFRYSLPLAQRVVVAVVLLSTVALLIATVVCACFIRHKQRQQRVLIEPPTVQQLGLDVPMLSSSPYSSGQVVQL